MINFKNISYSYNLKTPFEKKTFDNFSLTIKDNSVSAIIGQTGSGKSTLVKMINGLIRPNKGVIEVDDFVITPKTKEKKLTLLRKKVGLVFQNPERQLFAETVLKDVEFGPLNFGMSKEEAHDSAINSLNTLKFPKELFEASPFELSGGQMRKVAIAGILASKPEVIIFDEPTSGLDPASTKEVLSLLKTLKNAGKTIILITHQMDQLMDNVDEVFVIEKSQLKFTGTPTEFFINHDRIELNNWGADYSKSILLGEQIGIDKKNALTFQDLIKNFNNLSI